MIKKLDILILRSFIGPFIVTFFITLFVLVMQFFWLYMDELIGKGLPAFMILKLLAYMSTTMVPLALPLGILLASIMTFGSMGENFELVAIKSAGISLIRFMRPLFFFIAIIGALAFLFNNNVIPVANLKALSLLYDLRNSKPAFNIRAGQFYRGIEGFAIRVGEKDDDGRTIRNILIYDHPDGTPNYKVILAREGQMLSSPDKKYMIFRLKDGWRYEESEEHGANGRNFKQVRMHFKSWDKVFDLSAFRLNRTSEELFRDSYQMMDVGQLNEMIDSLGRYENRMTKNVSSYIGPYISVISADTAVRININEKIESSVSRNTYDSSFLQVVNDTLKKRVVQLVASQVRNSKGLLDITAADMKLQAENFRKFNIEWHRKFTLSFACILLFLIGAPLGAIIRKGGLGMPLVIAVGFFVIFHIISITGEKLAKTESLYPWAGMWMATGMLLPMAFLLINQARNDSQIFTKEWYIRMWNRIAAIFKTAKK